MLISTKGRYGLRAMIDIAENNTGEYIPLKKIAQRQEISEKYLESILPLLAKAGLLEGLRGKGGGYKLSRTPETYTVGSILKVLEGSIAPVSCLEEGSSKCPRMDKCRTLPMWTQLHALMNDFFEGVTLADLCKETEKYADFII